MFTADRVVVVLLASTFLYSQTTEPAAEPPEANPRLALMKRICVDKFAGEESLVATVREIAIASLFSVKRFTVTENCEKVDATLKGAVIERAEKRVRAEGEATDFGVAAGGARVSGRSASAGFGSALGGSGESLLSAETGSRASVTVRLVDASGDVLWAYTQDSPGGKTKGAVSDAVDRAIKQLQREIVRAEKK
jgi:hypothetical protein